LDFELTEEQIAVMKAAEEFARKETTPELLDKVWKEGYIPWDVLRKAGELRFICPHWKEEHGGGGLD